MPSEVLNKSVVASQQSIEHFRNMIRIRFTTNGGAATETLTLPNIDLSSQDYVRIIPDPNSQVMAADLIEIKASRSLANGVLTIGSSDGSNMAAGVNCEAVIIKRQMGDGSATARLVGNTSDTIFGKFDEGGTTTFNPNGGATTVLSNFITPSSIVWVDQKSVLSNLSGGLCEIYASRVSQASFAVNKAKSGDTGNGNVTFDWIVFNP